MTTVDQYYLDFNQIVQDITRNKRYGKNDLAIWGGTCAESELMIFLENWLSHNMPFRVWEYVSEICFQRETLPKTSNLLEQGRLFGEDGDLTLRRDGSNFRWYFVGRPDVQPPDGCIAENFWEQYPEVAFYCCEETALLWGERQNGGVRWFDDRVGHAELDYPIDPSWNRPRLYYRTFSRAGQIEFVWFHGLKAWEEHDNG
jgi:hypothetical protein